MVLHLPTQFTIDRFMNSNKIFKKFISFALATLSVIFISNCKAEVQQQTSLAGVTNFETANPTQTQFLLSLADSVGMKIGTSVLIIPLREDVKYREILAQEFNSLTPENAMKFGQLSPARGEYNFADADEIVAFAKNNNMQIHGHTLVWHKNLPSWFRNGQWSRQEAMNILRKHIFTVVRRYRGQVTSWDVVNEAVNDEGVLRDSIWLQTIGPDYIQMAFRWAHAADPKARLFYNDYSAEQLGKKSNAVYELVKQLRQKNVPIHGVGFQMHTSIRKPPNSEAVSANMQRLGELGLEVKITEMDVKIHEDDQLISDKLAAQAKIYQDIASVCLKAPNCNSLTTWGLADHWSWVPQFFDRTDAPLLFDEFYQPKPAYTGLVEVFQGISITD